MSPVHGHQHWLRTRPEHHHHQHAGPGHLDKYTIPPLSTHMVHELSQIARAPCVHLNRTCARTQQYKVRHAPAPRQ